MRAFLFPGILCIATNGCRDEQIVELQRPDISEIFWALQVDIEATTVALNGTQQIVATPRNSSGQTLPNLPKPKFRSADPTKVTVDSNGVITGVTVTIGIAVVSSLTVAGVTNVDTTMVVVTPNARKLKTFALTPSGGYGWTDQVFGISGYQDLGYTATDSSNVPITGIAVTYRSLDPNILRAADGVLTGISLGKVKLIATTTSYGITMSDTIEYRVGYPLIGEVALYSSLSGVSVGPLFYPSTIRVGVGALIVWSNNRNQTSNITFDDPTNIEGGNAPEFLPFDYQIREFHTEGTYTYRDTVTGATGTIIVLRDDAVSENH